MSAFLDAVWEIDPWTDTMHVLYEPKYPALLKNEHRASELIGLFAAKHVPQADQAAFCERFSAEKCKTLATEEVVDFPVYHDTAEAHITRFVLTPAPKKNARGAHADIPPIDAASTPFYAPEKNERFHVYVSIRDIQHEIDEETRRLTVKNEVLSRTISEQEQFRIAALSGSVLIFNVNLTKDRIEDDIFEIRPGERRSILAAVGMNAPCSFERFLQVWAARRVEPTSRQAFLELFDRKTLLDRYENGSRNVEGEFTMVLGDDEESILRNTVIIWEDWETGDILATISGKDMTAQRKKEKQKQDELLALSEYLKDSVTLLSARYEKVYRVNFSTDTYSEIDADHNSGIHANFHHHIYSWFSEILAEGEVHPADTDAFIKFGKFEGVQEAFLAGETRQFCDYRRLVGKEYRWVRIELIKAAGFSEENQVVLLCVYDMHDEIMREEALKLAYEEANRANAAKTDFLSTMSHDMRTPMNAIIGLTAIALAHTDEPERIADALEKIIQASNNLLELINKVLDMNKIESGTMELDHEPFSMRDLAQTLTFMASPLMQKQKHSFTLKTKIDHALVYGDRQRLEQVCMNLIGNAAKYTHTGGHISCLIQEKPAHLKNIGLYEIIVADDGIGIDPAFLPHIFEPFSRREDSRVTKTTGSGLGLPISRNIVRMMNGDISVESTPGKGSVFTAMVHLDFAEQGVLLASEGDPSDLLENGLAEDSAFSDIVSFPADGEDSALDTGAFNDAFDRAVSFETGVSPSVGALPDVSPDRFRGKRALLVEDNDINAEITTEVLSMIGFEVERAENGQIAVNMVGTVDEGYYHIIFMDVQMPVMNGYEATRAIRASGKAWLEKIPIFALTANAFADDVRDALHSGMNEHLAKPMDFERLVQLLNQYLAV